MKNIRISLCAVALIFVSSCGLFNNNNAKMNELHRQIELVNRELSELNKSYTSLNTDLASAREKVKKVDELASIKREEERKEMVRSQIAYMQQLQKNLQDVQEKISEKQERMAMLSNQVAKLE